MPERIEQHFLCKTYLTSAEGHSQLSADLGEDAGIGWQVGGILAVGYFFTPYEHGMSHYYTFHFIEISFQSLQ